MRLNPHPVVTLLFWTALLAVLFYGSCAHAECNGVYRGFLQGEVPLPPYFAYAIEGTLTDFWDDGESAYLVVDGQLLRIQHPNLQQIRFDNGRCEFEGMYDADPIFKAG